MKNRICMGCGHYEVSHHRERGCVMAAIPRFEGKSNDVEFCTCNKFMLDDGVYLIFRDCELEWAIGCEPSGLGFNPNGDEMKQQIYAESRAWDEQ